MKSLGEVDFGKMKAEETFKKPEFKEEEEDKVP